MKIKVPPEVDSFAGPPERRSDRARYGGGKFPEKGFWGRFSVKAQPSWPGLSRPSTSPPFNAPQDVDARHKAGHDGVNIAESPCQPGDWS
jgi:hypothetical protein